MTNLRQAVVAPAESGTGREKDRRDRKYAWDASLISKITTREALNEIRTWARVPRKISGREGPCPRQLLLLREVAVGSWRMWVWWGQEQPLECIEPSEMQEE